ncbi:hypothetical protein [uncultured Zobellia sp.]|uniref:hypothetical protein n=1 Tax=uncultured Zobellia sp. TaxID=255433 RepID=UPI002594F2BB|nr:hypothetical protein [uncultured Zobellia sp.]
MKVWLEKLTPPKFLRYFFYISYRWYTGYVSERYQAHYTSVLFLSFIHFFLLFFLLLVFLPNVFVSISYKYPLVFSIVIILGVIHYFLFLYKNKWRGYVKEFKYLSDNQRFKGTILLFTYLFFSITLAASPIYFGELERNKTRKEKRIKDDAKNYNTYGIAKCISIQKEKSSKFVFFEFYIDGRRVLGTSPIVAVDDSLVNKYFKVKYSSKKINESKLLLNHPITDTVAIKKAGFSLD